MKLIGLLMVLFGGAFATNGYPFFGGMLFSMGAVVIGYNSKSDEQ